MAATPEYEGCRDGVRRKSYLESNKGCIKVKEKLRYSLQDSPLIGKNPSHLPYQEEKGDSHRIVLESKGQKMSEQAQTTRLKFQKVQPKL